jgi:antitoxin (DNA-binding transcriptional repressor) of toxin-antitoxin stability system
MSNMSNMTAAEPLTHRKVGLRELGRETARVPALVKQGETIDVTDRGVTVARIVPAADDRYEQLVAAGIIRPASRPFSVDNLPAAIPAGTGLTSDEVLSELRGH